MTETSNIANDHLIDQAPDLYCHGIARIDNLGPNRRLVFTIPSLDGSRYQNVVVKLILPAGLLTTLAYLAVGADRNTFSPELIALETTSAN
jgi:hypothetical protein